MMHHFKYSKTVIMVRTSISSHHWLNNRKKLMDFILGKYSMQPTQSNTRAPITVAN